MSSKTSKPTALALGAALALTGTSAFAMEPMSQGYMASASAVAEGSCGAEHKKSEEMKTAEAKHDHAEGKCGVAKMDTDKDGRISKAEFAAAHDNDDSKFAEHDLDKDGFISDEEMKTHMGGAGGEGKMMEEGKCGEGKCGANM